MYYFDVDTCAHALNLIHNYIVVVKKMFNIMIYFTLILFCFIEKIVFGMSVTSNLCSNMFNFYLLMFLLTNISEWPREKLKLLHLLSQRVLLARLRLPRQTRSSGKFQLHLVMIN